MYAWCMNVQCSSTLRISFSSFTHTHFYLDEHRNACSLFYNNKIFYQFHIYASKSTVLCTMHSKQCTDIRHKLLRILLRFLINKEVIVSTYTCQPKTSHHLCVIFHSFSFFRLFSQFLLLLVPLIEYIHKM